METTSIKLNEITRDWYIVDAEGQTLGRLASKIAQIIRGKAKPAFTPHMDMGDFVVVINAEKVKVTGNKEEDKKYKQANPKLQATQRERMFIRLLEGLHKDEAELLKIGRAHV